MSYKKGDRFWSKVQVRGGGECWPWLAGKTSKGYGTFWVEPRRAQGAHRVMWRLVHGEIPDGCYVCHSCDNPSCVNPYHLFLGTPSDNLNDAYRKGRKVGPNLGGVKLTPGEVSEIKAFGRVRWSTKRRPKGYRHWIASEYGVHAQTITDIWAGKVWSHV